MASMILPSGRVISLSCPHEINCFANQYCEVECPPTLFDVLKDSAVLEHELDLLPHNDQDIIAVCPICWRK